ncbi:MAG: tetratricopeptide repeat protein [Alphaproteobacteria bacterium]|nr:tetratricopeptide repeat protein [Alphaproteobacteria bacterium]
MKLTRTLRVSNVCLLGSLSLLCALLIPLHVSAWTVGDEVSTHSLAGSYLAGRFARSDNDSGQAANFYRSALNQDPESGILLERAFLMEASEANWDRAIEYGEEVVRRQPRHRMARLLLGLKAFKSGDFEKSIENFKAAGSGPIGELTSVITRAWVEQAMGRTNEALASLTLRKQADWARFYLRYHRALIADQAGRTSDAKRAFESVFQQDSKTLRTALAYARSTAATGDYRRAKGILRTHLRDAAGEDHPLVTDLMDRLSRNEKITPLIATPQEGLAEVLYGLGEALTSEGGVSIGILYLQMALYLEPRHPFALAALASAYETMKRYDMAIETYQRIPSGSALQVAVDIRKAFNLNELERVDEAVALLEQVAAGQQEAAEKELSEPPAAATVEAPSAAPSTPDQPARKPGAAAELSRIIKETIASSQVMQPGNYNRSVKALQRVLGELGYNPGPIDGLYGQGTRIAVQQFQERNQIPVDGIAGPETLAALDAQLTASQDDRAVSDAPAGGVEQANPSEDATGQNASDNRRRSLIKPYDALGNIMRARKRYDEAIGYYSKVIELVGKPEQRDWVYYYSRGTCYERVKNWPSAEADLKQALKLDPNQALTLNYLGYSWIDQNLNLREGMKLIEKAVSLKPDDGYIVDSLGWAHYRTGDYQEAVRFLEKAVELRPEDPVLNDHLGDAYWQLGRIREARFQWDQALSLKPEPDLVGTIEKKLADGLPVKRQALADPNVTGKTAPVAETNGEKDASGSVPAPQRSQ